MAEPKPRGLRIWDGGMTDHDYQPADLLPLDRGTSVEDARRLFLQEALLPRFRRPRDLPEPFSLAWFLEAEGLRYGRHGRWIPRLLEFAKHVGERLLCLGSGLGTDWTKYASHGADVIACAPSADQLALVQRNFQLRGLRARFVHASPTVLPLEAASIDVACVTSLLRPGPSPEDLVEELYRVLKPGGKVLVVAPAAYDVDFWCRDWIPWASDGRDARGEIYCSGPGHTCRGLRRLFARFGEFRAHRRQLRRQDLPHLLRWLPLPLLERAVGRFLIVKAFKPVSAALPSVVAA